SLFRFYRNTNRLPDAPAERPCRAFYSRRVAKLRMTRRFGVQLPKSLDFRHRQIVTAHVQPGVKKHAAVSGREDKDVAIDPARLIGIVSQRVAKKHRAYFRAAEW